MSEEKVAKETEAGEEAEVVVEGEAAVKDATAEDAAVEEAPLTPEEQLAAAQAQAAEYLDGWQRARAELANARKRFERQRVEAYNNAVADVVRNLLPVVDDYDRAMENVPEGIAQDGWFEGIVLVRRKLQTMLDNLRVESIAAVGQPFDPNLHEALSQKDSDEYESGVVVEEVQKGYKVGDRVIRPSLVFVAA